MKCTRMFLMMFLIVGYVLLAGSLRTVQAATSPHQQFFLNDLRLGATGNEVKRLQEYLNNNGAPVASSGPGSSGNETQYYGPATACAVSYFQELHADAILSVLNLIKGTGNFFTSTRNFVNQTLVQGSIPSVSSSNLQRKSTRKYTIGGSVSGLTDTLVLDTNDGDSLTISNNGAFVFPKSIVPGSSYSISITSQPVGQTCNVVNGSGTNIKSNVTNISVTCATNSHTVGGTISGLSGTVVLLNNSGDANTVTSNGGFIFDTPVTEGTPYNVTVQTQPEGQTCVVTNGNGTMGESNVTNVSVSCSAALVSITITPSNSHLPTGINMQYIASGTFSDASTVDITDQVTWDVSNQEVVAINGTGRATGIAPGIAQISASLDGILGTTNLTVTDATLVFIMISPSNPAVARDSTLQLSAIGTFSDATSVDITEQTTWTSTVTNVAIVNNTDHKGVVTGVAGGASSIHADLNSITGSATLFVGS